MTIHRRDAPPGPAGRWLLERLAARREKGRGRRRAPSMLG